MPDSDGTKQAFVSIETTETTGTGAKSSVLEVLKKVHPNIGLIMF